MAKRKYPTPPPAKASNSTKTLLLALASVAVAAVVVVAIVVIMSSSGAKQRTDYPATGSLTNALLPTPLATDVETLLKGIPQSGTVLGRADAKVTLVEYEDPQCPACQLLSTQVMPQIIRDYVRTGQLRLEYRGVTFVGGDPGSANDSERGLKAALAAGEQGKFWNFIELLYYNQGAENTGWLNDNMVIAVATSIPGLDVNRVLQDRRSGKVASEVEKYRKMMDADKVTGTPTLFIGYTGGKMTKINISSAADTEKIVQAIKALLR